MLHTCTPGNAMASSHSEEKRSFEWRFWLNKAQRIKHNYSVCKRIARWRSCVARVHPVTLTSEESNWSLVDGGTWAILRFLDECRLTVKRCVKLNMHLAWVCSLTSALWQLISAFVFGFHWVLYKRPFSRSNFTRARLPNVHCTHALDISCLKATRLLMERLEIRAKTAESVIVPSAALTCPYTSTVPPD